LVLILNTDNMARYNYSLFYGNQVIRYIHGSHVINLKLDIKGCYTRVP